MDSQIIGELVNATSVVAAEDWRPCIPHRWLCLWLPNALRLRVSHICAVHAHITAATSRSCARHAERLAIFVQICSCSSAPPNPLEEVSCASSCLRFASFLHGALHICSDMRFAHTGQPREPGTMMRHALHHMPLQGWDASCVPGPGLLGPLQCMCKGVFDLVCTGTPHSRASFHFKEAPPQNLLLQHAWMLVHAAFTMQSPRRSRTRLGTKVNLPEDTRDRCKPFPIQKQAVTILPVDEAKNHHYHVTGPPEAELAPPQGGRLFFFFF